MNLSTTFAASTWLWDSPFSDQTLALFPKIKAMGFDAVEIPVEDPALVNTGNVRAALQRHELTPLVCGVFGADRDFTHDDPAYHERSFRYIESCLEICEQLGATFVAGPMYAAVGKARVVSADQKKREWDRAVSNLKKVCRLAGDKGLSLAIEPLNRFESDLVNTADDVMRLVTAIDHPAAKVLLDGFHMTIEELNLEQAIRRVGDKLVHVQVSENNRGIPGSGQTRWDDFKKGLLAIGYQGAVTIESFTPEIKALAGAVCIWRPLAPTQDEFAARGLAFLKQWARG